MNFSQRQITIIAAAAVLVLVVGLTIYFNLRLGKGTPVSLTVWGFEKEDVFTPVIQSYNQLRPNVTVAYKQVPRDGYGDYLLNALASGQGPDIFPVHNRALPKYLDKLAPAASTQFGAGQLESLFPTVVEEDFAYGTSTKSVYALPLYIDTLSLIYNKDSFDQAGIANPPQIWKDFQSDAAKLRSVTANGQIRKAGAAIGGSQKTIATAPDILSVLMLQNGASMTDPQTGAASFASLNSGAPGIQAFNFYLQFANPGSSYYTWNENQPDYLQSFANGSTAMILDYSSAVSEIKTKNPFLNIGSAPLPQTDPASAVNYADYWGFGVSRQSQASAWAWDFIIYATAQESVSKMYLGAAGKPPALRTIIAEDASDPALGVFAKQALTARSWYEADETKIDTIFSNAVSNVLSGQLDSTRALQQAQDQVNQLTARQ